MGGMCPLVGTMAELPCVPGHPQGTRPAVPSLAQELVSDFAFLSGFLPT